jgi:hypothetical protein
MEEAERIAKEEHGSVKVSVISGRNIQYAFVLVTLLYILFREDSGDK